MTSLEQLENDTETSRVRVAELLEELRGRISPGELVDQVVDFAGNGAIGDFGRTLGDQVRNNPLPCVLIGVGLVWLMTGGRHGNAPSVSADSSGTAAVAAGRGRDAMQGMREAAGAAGSRASDAARGAAARVSGAAADVAGAAGAARARMSNSVHRAADVAADAGYRARGAVADAASSFTSRARSVSSSVQSAAGAATGAVKDAAAAAAETVQDAARNARDVGHSATEMGRRAGAGLAQTFQDQPLLMAGLGLALGAALGAALPTTEAERRVMGDTSEAMKARARQAAVEQADKARRVAERTYEAAKTEAGHVAEEAAHAVQHEGFPAGTLRAEHERNEHVRPETK